MTLPEDRPNVREWMIPDDVLRWRLALEQDVTGLRREDLTLIFPKVLVALEAGWHDIHFEVLPSSRRMTVRAERGPYICSEEIGLRPGQSVADGVVILLEMLVVPMPSLPVEAEVARWLPEDVDAALEDRVHTLVDLAKAGQKEDFTFLAGAVGVAPGDLEALWAGTVARLTPQEKGGG